MLKLIAVIRFAYKYCAKCKTDVEYCKSEWIFWMRSDPDVSVYSKSSMDKRRRDDTIIKTFVVTFIYCFFFGHKLVHSDYFPPLMET